MAKTNDIYDKFFVFLMTSPNNEVRVKDCEITKNGVEYTVKRVYDDEGTFYVETLVTTFPLYDLNEQQLEKIFKHIEK